ncbi:DUF2750 domain-containing protein [Shewanella sp. OPT22]|nr:DUF2750 domain-containing protein [Shewanella sp. OPT22]
MSYSSLNSEAFYSEISESGKLWGIRDENGIPAPKTETGQRSMPFWSKKSRAEKIIHNVPAYGAFETFEISVSEFIERWLPGLENDELLVGLNWSGKNATGYDSEPNMVLKSLKLRLAG